MERLRWINKELQCAACRRSFSPPLLMLLMLLMLTTAVPAQEAVPEEELPPPAEATEQPPAAVPEAPAGEPAQPAPPLPAHSPEQLLSPQLFEKLRLQWEAVRGEAQQFYDPDNLTVLSVPDGSTAYMAAVADIRGAADASGLELSVEDVIFTEEHLLGQTPLSVTVPSGEYVLALRSAGRQAGFDGGCVRKTSVDVVTGGRRHAYHLYPLRKRSGQYMCFVANFIDPGARPVDIGEELLKRGTFAIPMGELVARLAQNTSVPPEQQEQTALMLNRLGSAYFELDDGDHLVKLSLKGDGYFLDEWPVETGEP